MDAKPFVLALLLVTSGCVGPSGDEAAGDGDEPVTLEPLTGSNGSAPAGPAGAPPAQPQAEGPGGFSDTHVFEGDYATDTFFSQVLHEGPHQALPAELVQLDSPVDGVPIGVEIHRPNVSEDEPVPVIVQISPYYEDSPFHPRDATREDDTYAAEGLYAPALVDNYVPHGYAVALVALRGTADSGGCWDTLGPKATEDIDHALDWLADRPWRTGALGVMGASSQDGAAAWQAAATGNPHVRTVVPVAAWNDHYGMLFPNGSWSALSPTFWSGTLRAPVEKTEPPRGLEDLATADGRVACPELVHAVAASLHAPVAGAGDPQGYWQARDLSEAIVTSYNGSAFVVHGLADPAVRPSNLYPWIHELESQGIPVKHLIGQWAHVVPDVRVDNAITANPTPRVDFAEILLHWFDYWLKGNTSRDLGPRVQVADTDHQWRSADAWPPRDATTSTFALTPDGALSRERTNATDTVLVGPDAEAMAPGAPAAPTESVPCPACPTFQTPPFEETFRFAGTPLAHLNVTPAGPGGYLTVELLAATPDGEQHLLTSGQMDLRFAEDPRSPSPVLSGEKMQAPLALEPQDAVLEEGQRLVLRVMQGSQGEDPQFRQLPGVPPTPVRLHVGAHESTLALETFTVPAGSSFTPPPD